MLRQTLRSAAVRRGRETVAWIAIGGTLAAMCFTAFQVRQGWTERRLAAESSVRDGLTTAAVLIGTEAARMSGLELRALLWPALGTNGWPNARSLTLDAFARAGAGVFVGMHDDRGAPQPGYFRLSRTKGGEWATELSGALTTDSVYARTVLAEVRRWANGADLDKPGARIGIIHPTVRGEPFVVGMAPERGADGHAVALFGVSYARSVALRTHVRHVLRDVSLLPAASRAQGDSTAGRVRKVDNTAIAVRLRHGGDLVDAVSSSANDEAVWRSRFVAARAVDGPDGGFTVEVAVPEDVGRSYVADAMPTISEQLMLVGVLLLGVGFAAAAALALRRQYKLAETRRMFVAAVSHELRTPLAHVNALSETLMLGRAESPEQAQRWLRAIHREGRRLSVLTENVLMHARGERRGIRAEPQWTDISAVVYDAVSLVEAQAQARSAKIVVTDNAVDRAAGGWTDAAALRQIMINFIENALKFGPVGQTVIVTFDVESPSSGERAESLLRLSVADEGPGVPLADRERIWQPFVRLAEGGSAPAGTGLGLSVVRQLIEELGGHCSVRNVAEQGALFSVEIPLAAPATTQRHSERSTDRASSSSLPRQTFASSKH